MIFFSILLKACRCCIQLEEFIASHYVAGNMAVAGVGVEHSALTELVGKMPIRDGAKPAVVQKAKYHGGDVLSRVFYSLTSSTSILD